MEQEKTFYVGIKDVGGVRRDILGCSKDIIGVLKNYDGINQIRERKIERIIELKKVLSELKRLSNMLRGKLPSEKVRVSKPIIPKRSVKKVIVKKTSPKNNQISKLEDELNEIETRLNNMTV